MIIPWCFDIYYCTVPLLYSYTVVLWLKKWYYHVTLTKNTFSKTMEMNCMLNRTAVNVLCDVVDNTRFYINKRSMCKSLTVSSRSLRPPKLGMKRLNLQIYIKAVWQTAIGLSCSPLPKPAEATKISVSFGGIHVLCV